MFLFIRCLFVIEKHNFGNPGLTNVQVRQKLVNTAKPLGDAFYYGKGVIDVYAATR